MFLCLVPADFPWFEVTLDSHRLFSAEAAEVCIIVTDITLLIFFHNLVSTDGLITDWPKKNSHADNYTQVNTHTYPESQDVYNYLQ